jgi:DNA processing protein
VTPKEAFIALNMVPCLGPVNVRRLLQAFGSPDRILTAGRGELNAIEGLSQDIVDSIVSWESAVDLQREMHQIREFGATVLTLDDHEYPPSFGKSTIRRPHCTYGASLNPEIVMPSGS